MLTPWKESYDQPRQHIKKQRHYFANKGPSSQGYGFSSSHVWTLELDYKESWAPKNWCFWTVVLEKILESPWDCKETQPVLGVDWKDWCWSWNSNNLATWCEKLTHLKRPWCWKRLRAGEGDDRRWDGWMASSTQCTWVWIDSGSWWWTGRPGILQFMGLQRVGHDWVTELNWTELKAFNYTDHNKLWKILKEIEMGIPDHLTCFLRNLYVDQEAKVRNLYRTLTGSGLRRVQDWENKTVYCHPVYSTHTQSTSWEMPVWMS